MGAPQVDTSVLLAAGLSPASALACQGSMNFLLKKVYHATEWIHFHHLALRPLSALGGCRGQGETHLGTPEQRLVAPGVGEAFLEEEATHR